MKGGVAALNVLKLLSTHLSRAVIYFPGSQAALNSCGRSLTQAGAKRCFRLESKMNGLLLFGFENSPVQLAQKTKIGLLNTPAWSFAML